MKSEIIEFHKCGACGIVHRDKERADDCCICIYCGKPKGHTMGNADCEDCRMKMWAKRDHERMEKRELVEYDGTQVLNNDSDGYYFDDDDVYCYLEDLELDEMPEFLIVCTSMAVDIDPDGILENEMESHYEDATDHLVDIDGFRKYINEWCKKQTLQSWIGGGKKVSVAQIRKFLKMDEPTNRTKSSK